VGRVEGPVPPVQWELAGAPNVESPAVITGRAPLVRRELVEEPLWLVHCLKLSCGEWSKGWKANLLSVSSSDCQEAK
jgi:hypothetical protein